MSFSRGLRGEGDQLTEAVAQSPKKPTRRDPSAEMLHALNAGKTGGDRVSHEGTFPLGPSITVQKYRLGRGVDLGAERMSRLVLREPVVSSEKEVVANERCYRVDDDVEGAVSELRYKTAYTKHADRWPTIGWMADIEGFTTEDCAGF